jgi:hypothetical protein
MAFERVEEMPDFTFHAPRPSTTQTTLRRAQSPDPTGLDELLALEAIVDKEMFSKGLEDVQTKMKNDFQLRDVDRGRAGDLPARETKKTAASIEGHVRKVLTPKSALLRTKKPLAGTDLRSPQENATDGTAELEEDAMDTT